MDVPCFCLTPASSSRYALRRYSDCDRASCAPGRIYHNASAPLRDDAVDIDIDIDAALLADPRWPTKCEHCDYVFADDDPRQVFESKLFTRDGTSEVYTLEEAPPGAMWNASWAASFFHGDDGACMVVKTPPGIDWYIDGPANNCTRVGEPHHCWIRTGSPPNLTVSKGTDPAATCSAGAGSIQVPGWHGYLIGGVLKETP